MKPTQSDVHVNRPLSNIVVAFMQDANDFVARSVFPPVPAPNKTDSFYKWNKGDFLRVSAKERAPGAPSEGSGITLTTDTFNCREYAIHYDLPDAIAANADPELRLEESAARWVANQLLLKREEVFVTNFIGTSIWTGGSGGATDQAGVSSSPSTNQFLQWNDAASTPIEDIRAQMIYMKSQTGYMPNTLTLGPQTWAKLVDHPDILDRIKYTQKGIVTTDLLASLLGLSKVVIGSAIKNTAAEGQTEAFAFFHGKYALLTYSAPAPAVMEPSAGYMFCWTTRFGNGPEGQRVRRWYDIDRSATRIEGEMNFDMKVIAAELGVYFTTAVA